jgi:hypothetical protein
LKFAKVVFTVAGIWGILDLLPLYFIYDYIGQEAPPAISHPEFYYGFAGVTLAWQFVFLLIGRDPSRYRIMMLPSILEKASYVLSLFILVLQHRVSLQIALSDIPDVILGLFFIAAYMKTKGSAERPALS